MTIWNRRDLLIYWVELNCLFNVTINDISVIYVTAHRCAGGLKKKYDLRSGSQRHRHFVGFFNVPVLAPTRDQPFYTVIPTHRPSNLLNLVPNHGTRILSLVGYYGLVLLFGQIRVFCLMTSVDWNPSLDQYISAYAHYYYTLHIMLIYIPM